VDNFYLIVSTIKYKQESEDLKKSMEVTSQTQNHKERKYDCKTSEDLKPKKESRF
jgi:hypothetical protein